jgi:uncharacterized protein involved in exopolysaccharide biosynthesis
MNDITERLRSHGVIPESLGSEAADEIERLRADLSTMEAAHASLQDKWAARPLSVADTAALKAENERLHAELARLAEAGTGYSQQTVDAITKERETLRALLKEAYANIDRHYGPDAELLARIAGVLEEKPHE